MYPIRAIAIITFLILQLIANGQEISYQLNLDNIVHHELKIQVTFSQLDRDTLEVRMPDASPGRYASHQFAKNVYELSAATPEGTELSIQRLTPNSWQVINKGQDVQLEYTLFANHADGTYSGIDSRKLHLNMPATFIYGVDLSDRTILLSIDLNDHPDWSVATQLEQKAVNQFSAPNYYYFFDSPVFVGKIDWRSWDVDGQIIKIAMMHQGTAKELDEYTQWVRQIVEAEKKIYGELPDFDFGTYTFLTAYNPWVHGDGMEHRNSTICSSQGNLKDHAKYLIGTIAHEFFHAWNVERIRPASLEPFDFDRPNMSEALWFAEGFTSYYDDLTLCRAGILPESEYITNLTGTLNYVVNSPGRKINNPIEMSHNAPFVDAATANDETNYGNTFISYYNYGAALGLVLDLSIRSSFKNITLDDFMRNVWIAHGKTEQPYTLPDLQKILAKTVNDEAFAIQFFDEYIYDSHLPDLKNLLGIFGVRLDQHLQNKVYFGPTTLSETGVLESDVIRGTGWYDAGVETGDRIIAINEIPINNQIDFKTVLDQLTVGESYAIRYEQLGIHRSGMFTAQPNPAFSVTIDTEAGKKAMKLRNNWLWKNQ